MPRPRIPVHKLTSNQLHKKIQKCEREICYYQNDEHITEKQYESYCEQLEECIEEKKYRDQQLAERIERSKARQRIQDALNGNSANE